MQYKNAVFDWPLDSNQIRRGLNANTFGMVRHNPDGTSRAHQGWDLFAPSGKPVHAVADGTVVFAGTCGDFGSLIVIGHPGTGIYSAYAHLSRIDRKQGSTVRLGEQIALSGCTGNAAGMTGPDQHLHFEFRTQPLPGLGLGGRISPLAVFGVCPMHAAVKRSS